MRNEEQNNKSSITNFLSKINYKFKNQSYLDLAITHSSFNEKKNYSNYERLEFLGDRVLGLVIAELVFKKHYKEKEGELSKRFADLVSKKTLIKIAKKINLEVMIKTSREYGYKIKVTESMLADSLEALIGAIFLDSDFVMVKDIVQKLWKEVINEQADPPDNPKSYLQEWCLRKKKNLPDYLLLEKKGPDHEPIFIVELKIENFMQTIASGSTKQEAEINAAKEMILKITNE
jgi:ribonuclease III